MWSSLFNHQFIDQLDCSACFAFSMLHSESGLSFPVCVLGEEDPNSSGKILMETFLTQLPNCVNRDLIDRVCCPLITT